MVGRIVLSELESHEFLLEHKVATFLFRVNMTYLLSRPPPPPLGLKCKTTLEEGGKMPDDRPAGTIMRNHCFSVYLLWKPQSGTPPALSFPPFL